MYSFIAVLDLNSNFILVFLHLFSVSKILKGYVTQSLDVVEPEGRDQTYKQRDENEANAQMSSEC